MSSPARKSVVEAQPLIAVRNVRASSRWYAALLGADALPDHPHRDVYDRDLALWPVASSAARLGRGTAPQSCQRR